MDRAQITRDDRGVMHLSLKKWSAIYGGARMPCNQKVLALGRLAADSTLTLPNSHWSRSLKGLPGLVMAREDDLALVPGGEAGRKIQLTGQVVDSLGATPGDTLCICQLGETYAVRSFSCRELKSDAPGWVVLDEFLPTEVVRWWASNPDVTDISPNLLSQMRQAVGQLRVDPLPRVCDPGTDDILPACNEFLGHPPPGGAQRLAAYVGQQRESQLGSGSWDSSVVTTAGTVIRLLQSGVPVEDETIRRAAGWLEQSDEPLGMPGLFLYEEKAGRQYNSRKQNGEALLDVKPTQQRAFFDRLSRDYYGPFLDLLPKYKACEPHTTWATALALQALLRCGLHDSPRVARAIRTLMQWRSNYTDCGGWCGCGIFGASLTDRGINPAGDADFDSAQVPRSNKDLQFASWFMTKAAVRSMVCNSYAENFSCLALGDNLGMLVRNRLSAPDSNCTTVMQSALALHPDYHGSKLELLAAFEMSGMQNPNGDFPSHRLSGMLHFLSFYRHPLATYLVYRALPALKRTQKEDGLWFSDDHGVTADDLLILSALKRMGLLADLIPRASG
jgi:hypothetical protein